MDLEELLRLEISDEEEEYEVIRILSTHMVDTRSSYEYIIQRKSDVISIRDLAILCGLLENKNLKEEEKKSLLAYISKDKFTKLNQQTPNITKHLFKFLITKNDDNSIELAKDIFLKFQTTKQLRYAEMLDYNIHRKLIELLIKDTKSKTLLNVFLGEGDGHIIKYIFNTKKLEPRSTWVAFRNIQIRTEDINNEIKKQLNMLNVRKGSSVAETTMRDFLAIPRANLEKLTKENLMDFYGIAKKMYVNPEFIIRLCTLENIDGWVIDELLARDCKRLYSSEWDKVFSNIYNFRTDDLINTMKVILGLVKDNYELQSKFLSKIRDEDRALLSL